MAEKLPERRRKKPHWGLVVAASMTGPLSVSAGIGAGIAAQAGLASYTGSADSEKNRTEDPITGYATPQEVAAAFEKQDDADNVLSQVRARLTARLQDPTLHPPVIDYAIRCAANRDGIDAIQEATHHAHGVLQELSPTAGVIHDVREEYQVPPHLGLGTVVCVRSSPARSPDGGTK